MPCSRKHSKAGHDLLASPAEREGTLLTRSCPSLCSRAGIPVQGSGRFSLGTAARDHRRPRVARRFVCLIKGLESPISCLHLTHKVSHDWQMRSATVWFAGLIAIASALCFAANPPFPDPDTATPPSTRLLQTLKHALDSDQLLQRAFFSDENLKTFFDASSIQWFIKDDDPPRIGKIVIIKSALVPKADIRLDLHIILKSKNFTLVDDFYWGSDCTYF